MSLICDVQILLQYIECVRQQYLLAYALCSYLHQYLATGQVSQGTRLEYARRLSQNQALVCDSHMTDPPFGHIAPDHPSEDNQSEPEDLCLV